VWAADASPAAREHLETIESINSVVADLEEVPEGFDGVIIANELLDNLPVAIAVWSDEAWEERWVGIATAGQIPFALIAEPARPEVSAWADAFAGKVPEGGLVEVQLAASAWLAAALDRLDRGAVVVVDYGGTAEELEPRRTLGTLRTYRAHHLGPDPLAEPGETDVTVDVNFTALLVVGERQGIEATLMRQDGFLADLGLRDELSRIRREELDEARSGDAMKRLVLRSERTDAETLLHPRGLGDFRVLVATKG
jgi:SAM-dependent MidA family methyltransferase